MKTIKIALFVFAIAFTSTLSASTDPVKTKAPVSKIESTKVSKEIKRLLENPNFLIEKELTAFVIFTLNDQNEIVVLSVKTEYETLENYIKSRLNYSKLDLKLNSEKKYGVPVTIKFE